MPNLISAVASPVACSALLAVAALAAPATGAIQITEWMYQGANGEFVELTNVGASPVDLAGYSFDDDSRTPDTVSLSSLGVVAAGESVVITETEAGAFRAAWNLPAATKVLGSNTTNFGRADEFNVFDAGDVLVDRLAYNDQVYAGTFRTQNVSANVPVGELASQVATPAMALSSLGDSFASYRSLGNDLANPGVFVPEPATLAAAGIVAMLVRPSRRRR